MKSMTGFGRSETVFESAGLTVEARGENHRFLDIRVQLPETAGFLEADIVKQVKRFVLRGKVKVTVINGSDKKPEPEIDLNAARSVFLSLIKMKKTLRLKGDITFDHIVSFGDVISKGGKNEKPGGKEAAKIRKTAADAIAKLNESRTVEGKLLKKELTFRASQCGRLVRKIKSERGKAEKETKRRLAEKTKILAKDKNMDQTKLYQEMAAILEKSDITEEIVRINSHLARFSEFLSEKNLSVGKELDFLIQEMNREAGTISAKSKSPAVSLLTIDLRSGIEKMREQVQNVE